MNQAKFRFTTAASTCLVLLLGALAMPSVSRAQTENPQMLLSAFYGNNGWNPEELEAMEAWQGQTHAVVNLFANWRFKGRTVPKFFALQLPTLWNNGNIPMITWEPWSKRRTPEDIEVRIADGDYDRDLQAWAELMWEFLAGPDGIYGNDDDRRVYLRLAHEMNGDWYPWGAAIGGNSPADYVAMWRHVHSIFEALGIEETRLQWVWCVNNFDFGGHAAEAFYPGDDVVDWLAVDGYNWGDSIPELGWRTPEQIYGPMLGRLRALAPGKPIAVAELASASSSDPAAKSLWIEETYTYLAIEGIKMVSWFNEDGYTDWAVFGGVGGEEIHSTGDEIYNAYGSYRAASQILGLGSDLSNPRLLTDAQFLGQ